MQNQDTKQKLHNMGYRSLDPEQDKWAKPVGYSLFLFEISRREWSQRFRSAGDGSTMVWTRVSWEEGADLREFLPHVEAAHAKTITSPADPFDFHTDLMVMVSL